MRRKVMLALAILLAAATVAHAAGYEAWDDGVDHGPSIADLLYTAADDGVDHGPGIGDLAAGTLFSSLPPIPVKALSLVRVERSVYEGP